MRDLQECKNEIFRRRDQKLQKRKRRRRAMISLCLPLCLVGVLFLGILPKMQSKKSSPPEAETVSDTVTEIGEIIYGGTSITVASLPQCWEGKIQGTGKNYAYSRAIETEEEVQQICKELLGLTQRQQPSVDILETEPTVIPSISTPAGAFTPAQPPKDGYSIDILSPEGGFYSFFLWANTLENLRSGEQTFLGTEEKQQLWELLQLPQ